MNVTFLKKIGLPSDKTEKSSILNLVLKPISLLLTLAYTPLLLFYLGDEKYGLWSTILSIISWVNYCDVGIGHGLRNSLAKALTDKNYEKAKLLISSAYTLLTMIAIILLIIVLIFCLRLNWNDILNTKIEMTPTVLISMIFIVVNFVLALSNSILYALQISERIAVLGIIIQLINIVGILILGMFSSGNLVLLAILFGVSSVIVYVTNTVQIFSSRKKIKPNCFKIEKKYINDICNVGIQFFIIQVACIALFTVDNLIVSYLFGAEQVTPFNITYRVFNTLYSFFAAMCIPYWSQTTVALQRGDYGWIKNSQKHLYKLCFGFIIIYIIVAIFFKPLVGIWLGRDLEYQTGLIPVMCVYYSLFSLMGVSTHLINGTSKIKFQVYLTSLMGIINIPLSFYFARDLELGVVGVRLATTILMFIGAIVYPVNLHFILKKHFKNNGVIVSN